MPPKAASTPSKVPGRRPSSNQPKSSRQQFSACGACRIRRVRCDLKDLPDSRSCSNCREHGFNCVDEYRDVKSVKLLRRGRRIQQVEAVYGAGPSSADTPTDASSGPSKHSVIPRLDPQFFNSRFYPRFHIQRPIIEPEEFKARYISFFNGDAGALGIPGQLIAMILVVWAASYGVDEFGREESHDGVQGVRQRKQRTNEMVRELLHLIDIHGLPRKPSWDGVRVLLLIMPLTEDVADPLERLTMYETAINQVYTLCSLASPRSVNSGQGETVDALVRARIYWYAFVHEGITTGLRGGRLHLADDDLKAFQKMQEESAMPLARSQLTLTYSRRWALAPLRLAAACRQVHRALTGSKARSQPEIDEKRLHDAWESIENCWTEFEGLRSLGLLGILTVEEADRFVDGWKIFIFECHNVIRESLKQRILDISGGGDGGYLVDIDSQPRMLSSLNHLHAIAESKCHDIVRHVVSLIRRHLGTSFFEYDASLVRDGCFFAGYILADESDSEQDGGTCVQALSEMRWAFSKSEERMQTLQLIWESRDISHKFQKSLTPPYSDPPPPRSDDDGSIAVASQYQLSSAPSLTKHLPLASSPVDTSSPHFHDEEHANPCQSCSVSSCSSSVNSTASPCTPSFQAAVAPTPSSSYSIPVDYDAKSSDAPHHAKVYLGHSMPGSSYPMTGGVPPNMGGHGSQYAEQPAYPQDQSHQQQQPPHPAALLPPPPHGFVGADGLLYAPHPHTDQGDNHSYPYHGPPYSYS